VYASLVLPNKISQSLFKAYHELLHESPDIPLADEQIPVIFTYEIKSRETTPLCIGRNPIVGSDGRRILFQGIKGKWILHNLSTSESRLVDWPGAYRGGYLDERKEVIATFADDLVIYWGLRTTGCQLKY